MKRSLLFCLLAFCAPILSRGAELQLSEIGVARLPIVIAPKASEETRKVAKELADYLKRVTGAAFEVKAGDGQSGIVLGTLAEFPDDALTKPLEIRDRFDGREAF